MSGKALSFLLLLSGTLRGEIPDLNDGIYSKAQAEDGAELYATYCAHCHLPNGVATSDIDLRYTTELADTRSCDQEPKEGDLGVPGLKLIDVGDAENSSMYRRMLLRNDEGMPPFASSVVDSVGANLMRDWINQLSGCE